MFVSASKALAAMVSKGGLDQRLLLPRMEIVREAAFTVALAVAIEAREAGLGMLRDDDELATLIRKAQWEPHFYPYRPAVAR
jgi:malic enzyme